MLCVVVVALLSRVWHLTVWDLWTDEVHTLTVARSELAIAPAHKLAPLNFLLTRWTIDVFGLTELGGRIAPFLAGVLTVISTYWVGKRWMGHRAGLFAALLLAVSPWHVYWSQNARHFSLEVLLVLLSTHAFLLYWKSNSKLGIGLTPALIAVALSVHASAAFYLAAMLAFVGGSALFGIPRRRKNGGPIFERRHIIAFAMLGIVLVAYLPISMSISRQLTAIGAVPWNPPLNVMGSLVFYAPPYIALVGAAGVAFLWSDRDDLGFLLLSLVIVPVFLVAIASRVTIASAAYVLASLPPLALLVGVAIDRLLTLGVAFRAKPAIVLVVMGLFGAQLFELALYHSIYRGRKPRWREAVEYVRTHRRPGDVIVAAEADVVNHYLGSGDIRWYEAVDKELQQGRRPFASATGVWFLVYTADESLITEFESAKTRIVGSKELKLLLPLHYGPKDRTLGVFYEALK